jgi:hypothetical protein
LGHNELLYVYRTSTYFSYNIEGFSCMLAKLSCLSLFAENQDSKPNKISQALLNFRKKFIYLFQTNNLTLNYVSTHLSECL